MTKPTTAADVETVFECHPLGLSKHRGSVLPHRGVMERDAHWAWIAGTVTLLATHVACLLWIPNPLKLTNILQLILVTLAALFCWKEQRKSLTPYYRSLWLYMGGGFLLLTSAQGLYLRYVLLNRAVPFPMIGDYLWLLYPLPMIYLCLKASGQTRENEIDSLDFAQAVSSVLLLCVMIALEPKSKNFDLGYALQALAMVLASTLRYSAARNKADKRFFGRLSMYLMVYALTSLMDAYAHNHRVIPGPLLDLDWDIPIVLFLLISGSSEFKTDPPKAYPRFWDNAPQHVRRLASLGLALLAMITAGLLAMERPALGLIALTTLFLLFMARTLIRESNLAKIQAQLKYAAEHDALTGLANRSLLLREITKLLEVQPIYPAKQTTLLFIDLDGFKVINDSLGHGFGDRLLVQVAKRLNAMAQHGEVVSRLGGDEFVVLLQGPPGMGEILAERVIEGLRRPFFLENRVLHMTASVGLVGVTEGYTGDDLVRDADTAMYCAKTSGRNRCEIFQPSMLAKANLQLELETDLRLALQEKSVEVWYQPICSLETGTIVGMEALSRWRHPDRGLVPPQEFIQIAEDTGMILDLGRQVLARACFQAKTWNEQFESMLRVNVNVSGVQLKDPDFLTDLHRVLDETGLDPALLQLEVTETILMKQPDKAKRVLAEARKMGINICLDDFGTGYSSLSYLSEFPFDTLKIDRSFVRSMDTNGVRRELVRTIIQLAANLHKHVVAEGIETPEERSCLADLSCHVGQGFLFGAPLEVHAITAMLHAQEQYEPKHPNEDLSRRWNVKSVPLILERGGRLGNTQSSWPDAIQ